jgi:hypothetical protein
LCCHGIKVQGLFRIPGNGDEIADARRRLESGKDIDLGGAWSASGRRATLEGACEGRAARVDAPADVHVVAALLKAFYRELSVVRGLPAAPLASDVARVPSRC